MVQRFLVFAFRPFPLFKPFSSRNMDAHYQRWQPYQKVNKGPGPPPQTANPNIRPQSLFQQQNSRQAFQPQGPQGSLVGQSSHASTSTAQSLQPPRVSSSQSTHLDGHHLSKAEEEFYSQIPIIPSDLCSFANCRSTASSVKCSSCDRVFCSGHMFYTTKYSCPEPRELHLKCASCSSLFILEQANST
jgi:hypothetical protein